jgi:hypothetical protein
MLEWPSAPASVRIGDVFVESKVSVLVFVRKIHRKSEKKELCNISNAEDVIL